VNEGRRRTSPYPPSQILHAVPYCLDGHAGTSDCISTVNSPIEATLNDRWVRFGVGPSLLLAGGLIPSLWIKVPLLICGTVVVQGANIVGDRVLREAEQILRREDARSYISRALTDAVTAVEAARPAPAQRTLRANIMLFDREAGGLRAVYYTSGYSDAERSLVWRLGQGCSGVAWERKRTAVAPEDEEIPIDPSSVRPHSRPWNMTEDQVRITGPAIRSVVSTPVFLPQTNEVVAILSFDDSRPLEESALGNEDIRAFVEDFAEGIARVLPIAGTTANE